MMGSMYMSDVILNENLITTGYRKFWSVKGTATGYHRRPEDDIRTVRHRSRSCGAVYHRGRQELNRGAKTQKQDEFLPSATRDGILREPTGQIQRLPHYRVPQLSSSGENGNCANENIQGNGQRRTGFGDSSMVLTNTGDHHVTDGSRVTGMTDIVVDLNQDNLDLTWKNLLGSSAKTGFARLDTKTLQEIGWVSGAEETSDRRLTNEDIYKLTKAEFKRLQDQVRDVSLSIRNKFRASSYQSGSHDTSQSQALFSFWKSKLNIIGYVGDTSLPVIYALSMPWCVLTYNQYTMHLEPLLSPQYLFPCPVPPVTPRKKRRLRRKSRKVVRTNRPCT
ncbi:hypothetical protein DPMN_171382 [Dreissena polymorpha]|uniref:Uncharacterized protein n=1 Tax=Dreissena polymorpha TaxID=45954 RepID=A0A9D4E1L6_DREPO|nr:hypothetical protein DPMN_171382 [Dreissena polymorpha]